MNKDRYKHIREYYARYPDLFFEEMLGVKLKFHQRLLLRWFRLYAQIKDEVFGISYCKYRRYRL